MAKNIILAQDKKHLIGGKEFIQKPLTLRRAGAFLRALGGAIKNLKDTGLDITKIDMKSNEGLYLLIGQLLEVAPDIIIELLIVVIGAKEEDRELLLEEMTMTNIADIIATFIEQNDIEGMKKSFLALKGNKTS